MYIYICIYRFIYLLIYIDIVVLNPHIIPKPLQVRISDESGSWQRILVELFRFDPFNVTRLWAFITLLLD